MTKQDNGSFIKELSRRQPFDRIAKKHLQWLADRMEQVVFDDGEAMLHPGGMCDDLFFIHSGSVQLEAVGILDPTNNTGAPRINDALIALSFALGEAIPTPEQLRRGDTSPMINGVPHPDGKIDLGDVLVILRRVVGLGH